MIQGLAELIRSHAVLPLASKDALAKFCRSDDGMGDYKFAYNLNEAMRAGSVPTQWLGLVAAIEAGIEACRLCHPMTVYRAVGDVTHLGALTPGATWRTESFMSVSVGKVKVATHLRAEGHKPTGAVLTIHLPAGTPGVYLGANPSFSSEGELLLPQGMGFRIVGVVSGDISDYLIPPQAKYFGGFSEIEMQAI